MDNLKSGDSCQGNHNTNSSSSNMQPQQELFDGQTTTTTITTTFGQSSANSLCRICETQPGGRHYRGICCLSCKAFFRRCIREARSYRCPEQNDCPIIGEYRTTCRACRMRKCLAAGLDPGLVHRERMEAPQKRKKRTSSGGGRGGGRAVIDSRGDVADVELDKEEENSSGVGVKGAAAEETFSLPSIGKTAAAETADEQKEPICLMTASLQELPPLQSQETTHVAPPMDAVSSSSSKPDSTQSGCGLLVASNRIMLEANSTLPLGSYSGLAWRDAPYLLSGSLLAAPPSTFYSSKAAVVSSNLAPPQQPSSSPSYSLAGDYFLRVERFCDSYRESNLSYHGYRPASSSSSPSAFVPNSNSSSNNEQLRLDINLPLDKALVEPGALVLRTAMDWSASCYPQPEGFLSSWARGFCYYVDWASHIPEMAQLSMEDRARMLIGRINTCMLFIFADRSIMEHRKDNNSNSSGGVGSDVILFGGGIFAPCDSGVLRQNIDPSLHPLYESICNVLFAEVLQVGAELQVSEAELALLKVLCFCVPVSGLSLHGSALVRDAYSRYESALRIEVLERCTSNATAVVEVVADTESQLLSHSMAALQRQGRLMNWLAVMERLSQTMDTQISVLTLFNQQMRGGLPYEVHVRRNLG